MDNYDYYSIVLPLPLTSLLVLIPRLTIMFAFSKIMMARRQEPPQRPCFWARDFCWAHGACQFWAWAFWGLGLRVEGSWNLRALGFGVFPVRV